MNIDIMLDYIRMISYALVILSSLRGIFFRKFNTFLFVGDIIMALGGLVTLVSVNTFRTHLGDSADIFLTPAVVLWAFIHFYDFVMFDKSKKATHF